MDKGRQPYALAIYYQPGPQSSWSIDTLASYVWFCTANIMLTATEVENRNENYAI